MRVCPGISIPIDENSPGSLVVLDQRGGVGRRHPDWFLWDRHCGSRALFLHHVLHGPESAHHCASATEGAPAWTSSRGQTKGPERGKKGTYTMAGIRTTARSTNAAITDPCLNQKHQRRSR